MVLNWAYFSSLLPQLFWCYIVAKQNVLVSSVLVISFRVRNDLNSLATLQLSTCKEKLKCRQKNS